MGEPINAGKRVTRGLVLVVDDERILVKAASRLLHSMGFEVLVATGGVQAVDICRSRGDDIDVVLLDLVLKEMTSMETLQELRSVRPGIKVILTSGYTRQESADRIRGMRVDGFISKPFGYNELENAICAALETELEDPKARRRL
jgi:two-component system, cell cycle sensor histidine kinase and response regulator CckA